MEFQILYSGKKAKHFKMSSAENLTQSAETYELHLSITITLASQLHCRTLQS